MTPVHKSHVVNRGSYTATTTLCGRSRTTSDGMNIGDSDRKVTCKFCLKRMVALSTLPPAKEEKPK